MVTERVQEMVAAPSRFTPRAEREAFGKGLRERVRRVDQDAWVAGPRDVVARVRQAEVGRRAELLPIKYGRMAVSPFAFLRGSAVVMAADLAVLPHTGYAIQICGDAHVRNLGAYSSPDGDIVFDLNDFDETCRAPWEWDLRRLATSIVLVGRESGNSERVITDATEAMVAAWRMTMGELAGTSAIELARYHVRRVPRDGVVGRVLAKAERSTPLASLNQLTGPPDASDPGGRRRFVEKLPKLRRIPDEEATRVLAALAPYRDTLGPARQLVLDAYLPYDVAFKIVGTGSIGTRDYVVLCQGNGPEDPLVLQVKQAVPSVYAPYVGGDPRIASHQGRRVAEGQHRLQTWVDPFLGWTTLDGFDFLVRQLADHKASIEPGDLRRDALVEYAEVAGEVFAKAHARTGDAAILYGYAGESEKLDRALAALAVKAADQATADWTVFVDAIKRGELVAEAAPAS
jgi:uncharacterized protein (DUF2252 family)